MQITLHRGSVQNLAKPDERGDVGCRINGRKVKLDRDLLSNVTEGDEILVAGEVKEDELHAVAMKNFNKGKTAQTDCTNPILLMAVGFIVGIMFAIFGMQTADNGGPVKFLFNAMAIGGFISAAIYLRRFLFLARASMLVS